MLENENLNEAETPQLNVAAIMRSFTIEDLCKAFEAGRTVSNYKAEWQETYNDNYTSAKYKKFEDWLKNYA